MSTVPPFDPPPAIQSWWSRLVSTAQSVLAGVISLGTALGAAFARNLFTVPAGILAFIFLFVLPQSRNLLWQLPALGGLSMAEFVLSVLLIAYLFALLAIYLVLCFCLIPRQHVPALGNPGIFARFATFRDRVESRIDAIVDFAASTRSRRISRHGSLLIVLAAGIMLITWYFDRSLPTWWRVSGSTYSTLLALTGFWLLFCPAGAVLGFKLRLTGRALVLFLVTNLVGQFLWMLPEQLPDYFSPRVFTIWAIIQISFLLVTTARVIDACHYASAWNIRALVVAGSLLGFLSMQSQQVGHFWRLPPGREDRSESDQASSKSLNPATNVKQKSPSLPMDETVLDLWFRAWQEAIERTDQNQPLIFVAASGGGARAAMFTSLVLEAMRHTPLPGHSSTAKSDPNILPEKSLADQIVLISGVSGGSLAAAYYVSQSYPHMRVQRDRASDIDQQLPRLVPKGDRTRYAWRNAFPNDIYTRMRDRSLRMLDETRVGRGRGVTVWAGTRFEKAVERVARECDQLAKGRDVGASGQAIAPWLATSAFLDDMSTDFTAPLLRGILNPGLERGVSVTRFWESQFGWRDVEDLDLHRQPNPDDAARGVIMNGAPIVMFNTCDVAQGSRIVLGFPPVPPGIIRDPLAKPTSNLAYSLTDRGDLYYHISLAEAVRLSANFPFGFEVGKLQLAHGEDPVLALDGGIVDNSGIDSIVFMFQGLARQVESYHRDWIALHTRFSHAKTKEEKREIRREFERMTCDSLRGRAYRLLSILAKRKVVLVQIDSGTKEIQTRNSDVTKLLAGLSPVIFRPFQALNNASYSNAEQAIELYDTELGKLKRGIDRPNCDCEFDTSDPPSDIPPVPPSETPSNTGQSEKWKSPAPSNSPTGGAAVPPAPPTGSVPSNAGRSEQGKSPAPSHSPTGGAVVPLPPPTESVPSNTGQSEKGKPTVSADSPTGDGGGPDTNCDPQSTAQKSEPERSPTNYAAAGPSQGTTTPTPPPTPPEPENPTSIEEPKSIPNPPSESSDSPPLIQRVRLTCNQSANIMTAWTLGPDDKAQVLVQFLIEWTHQRSVIEEAMRIQRKNDAVNLQDHFSRYRVFRKGQRLVDRARSEFYQSLAVPEASRVVPFPQSSPALDEHSKEDIRKYDLLFGETKVDTMPSTQESKGTAPTTSGGPNATKKQHNIAPHKS